MITVDLSALSSVGKNVQAKASEYLGEVNKIYQNVENLRNAWKGTDNQAYIDKVLTYKDDIENLGKVVNSYGLFCAETAANLERVQSEIASAAGKL